MRSSHLFQGELLVDDWLEFAFYDKFGEKFQIRLRLAG